MKIKFETIEYSKVHYFPKGYKPYIKVQKDSFKGIKFKTYEELSNFIIERFFPSEPIKEYRLDKNTAIPKIYIKDLLKNVERKEICDLVVTNKINTEFEIILFFNNDTTRIDVSGIRCSFYNDSCFDRLKLEQKLHQHKINTLRFLKKNDIDLQDVTFCIKVNGNTDTVQTIHPIVFWQNLSTHYGKVLNDSDLESMNMLLKSEDKENLQLLKSMILNYNWKGQEFLLHKIFIKINLQFPIRRTDIHGVLNKFFSYYNKSKIFGTVVSRAVKFSKPGTQIPLLLRLCSIPSPFITRKEFDILSFKTKKYLFDKAKENDIKIQIFPRSMSSDFTVRTSVELKQKVYSDLLSPINDKISYVWQYIDFYDLSDNTILLFSQNDNYVVEYLY